MKRDILGNFRRDKIGGKDPKNCKEAESCLTEARKTLLKNRPPVGGARESQKKKPPRGEVG